MRLEELPPSKVCESMGPGVTLTVVLVVTFLALRFLAASLHDSSSYFRFMVEFQWFLMALSVRPGISLAILAH